jgi:hypothetical protein
MEGVRELTAVLQSLKWAIVFCRLDVAVAASFVFKGPSPSLVWHIL